MQGIRMGLAMVVILAVVYRGGFVVGVVGEVLVVVVVALLPLLRNRVQHMELAAARALRGPSWTQSHSDPLAAAAEGTDLASAPHSVRTLCYNLFMRPSLWFVRNNDSDHKNERLAAFIRHHLEQFDIICLQEMFGLLSFRQRTLLSEADKRGFSHAAVAGAPPYLFWDHHWAFKIPFLDAGLVILSRFPIIQTDSHYYRLGNQIDGWAPKQVLWALVKLPGRGNYLNVFNTHMQASYYDAPSDTSDMARAKQINEMAAFVRQKVYETNPAGPHYPALILGDFNLDARTHLKHGPHSLDYVRMMDILSRVLNSEADGFVIRDLVYEQYSNHPVTYGDVREQGADGGAPEPMETILTHTADHCCSISIDYALFLGPKETEAIRHVETRIEPFFCDPGEAGPCTQLSDHYGIASTFLV